jgi:hypothetical protein
VIVYAMDGTPVSLSFPLYALFGPPLHGKPTICRYAQAVHPEFGKGLLLFTSLHMAESGARHCGMSAADWSNLPVRTGGELLRLLEEMELLDVEYVAFYVQDRIAPNGRICERLGIVSKLAAAPDEP